MNQVMGFKSQQFGLHIEKEGNIFFLFMTNSITGKKKRIGRINSYDDSLLFVSALQSLLYNFPKNSVEEVRETNDEDE